MVLALATMNYPSYTPALWQGTMVYWAVMAVAIIINAYTSKILPKLESFILVLHIMGFFAVLIPLVYVGGRLISLGILIDLQTDGTNEGFSSRRLHGISERRWLAEYNCVSLCGPSWKRFCDLRFVSKSILQADFKLTG